MKKKLCWRNAAEQERPLRCIVSEVNTEWLVRQFFLNTQWPPVRVCSSSVRKAEMRNASERRFKRQSSVIGNDRHTQSIHHSWPFHFSPSFPLLRSLHSGQGQEKQKAKEEKKSRSFRQLYLISVSKPHCDAIHLESAWNWNLGKGIGFLCMGSGHKWRGATSI